MSVHNEKTVRREPRNSFDENKRETSLFIKWFSFFENYDVVQ